MPIIIDNFHVRIDAPIDNRFVVGGTDSFYQDKNDIEHKYLGLRIWDLNIPGGPFCWKGDIEGWVSENAIGVTVDGSTSPGYLPVFTSGPTVLGNSLLYQTSNQIGIGILPSSINPNTQVNGSSLNFVSNGLHVSGNIKTNNYLIGKGDYITQLNAGNVVGPGLLDIRYISHLQSNGSGLSSAQYVLSNIGQFNSVTWKLANTLSVANADISNKITITDELNSSTIHYITFALGIGDQQLKINSSKIQFKPSTGQLFLSDGNAGAPVYSFLSGVSTGTGFYYNYSGNGNAVPSTIGGIGTSIEGQEITRTNRNGLVVNNRIYIQPTSNNLSDVGYGIVWLLNGATNDQAFNDGFPYTGGTNYNGVVNLTTQRLNYYGIGSHIPDNRNTPSSLAGRGTYIAGYFGVDIFTGNKLKVKVDEYNDVSIVSRLNIYNSEILGNSTNANVVLSTIQNGGGSAGNLVVIKDWSVRSTILSNASTQDSWLTWKHHNGITVDGVYSTPNGPAKLSGPDSPTYGTLTFWERHPYLHEQYFGSADRKTLTINSSVNSTGGLTSFVKVDGNILVGSSTTQITNSTGNIVVGSGNLLVGTNTIVPSAIVDFSSTTKGFLPPRMTDTQRSAISSAVIGLTIYNTDKKSLDTYNGSVWISNIKTTNVDIVGWVRDKRTANLPHNLNNIISYDILLQCITAQHGYVAGDITKPSPCYDDEDVTIKYNATSTTFDLLIGNQIRVRQVSAINTINNSEAITPANWRIRVVFYHYSTINQ
jgi:hypothetical protein